MANQKYWVITYPPFELVKKAGIFKYPEHAKEWAKQANRLDPNLKGRGLKAVPADETGFPLAWKKKTNPPSDWIPCKAVKLVKGKLLIKK